MTDERPPEPEPPPPPSPPPGEPPPAPPAGGARFCASCGAPLTAGARFCPSCGASVGGLSGSPPGPPPPPGYGDDPNRPPEIAGLDPSVRLSSAGRRLGGHVLDAVLLVVTLVIGWVVWSLIVWGRGQTPGKQLLGMRVLHIPSVQRASWGRMLLREVLGKWLIGFVAGVTVVGFILYFWLLWDDRRQELWDKMCDTLVVDDPLNRLA